MNESDLGPEPSFLDLPSGARLAYHRTEGRGPGIVFLGGFASDMTGSKATALEAFARERGQAFLRFDYEGHGASSGKFEEGTIGLWASNALSAIEALTEGPQILVGSSMGGWIMLLAALRMKERVAALVGLAPAPDFTEDLMWATFPPEVRRALESEGIYREPSDYSDEPYTITLRLIEEGRENLLLRDPIPLTCPVRLIHGEEDKDVPWAVSTKLMAALESNDVALTLVKGAGHRLSEPQDIARLEATLEGLLVQLES
ncbi:alpha/beta hydrolase family protein [Limibacillus halophilus]